MVIMHLLDGWTILAQQGDGDPGGGGLFGGGAGMWLPLVAIFALFYFLILRPQNRERAKMKNMLGNLQKNDRIVTIGGIYGTVVNIQKDSEAVTIKVDENSNTKLRVLRSAISRVVTGDDAADKNDRSNAS